MIDEKYIVKTISAVISKNSGNNISAIVIGKSGKPHYNFGVNTPKVCSMGLDICKNFYKSIDDASIVEINCPFGFKVSKKTVETNIKYKALTIYTLLSLDIPQNFQNLFNSLPRNLKSQREDVIKNLTEIVIDEASQIEFRDFLDSLLDTLLVGRIGLAIQTLSHQFFTPLQGAMADLNNIKDGIEVNESTIRLSKNFDSLAKLATEVQLLLSSAEEFNPNMLRRVTVHAMVSEIFESLKSLAAEKQISLNQKYNSFSKTVSAIPGQLHIVLSNIIHNAIKYSFRGFPHSFLPIDVIYNQDEEYLNISIINEGCKITNEEIKDGLLFELGYRGTHSRDRQRKGTGSGLYICREIVRSHGGQIDVSSTFVGGDISQNTDRYKNTFTVSWPIFHDY